MTTAIMYAIFNKNINQTTTILRVRACSKDLVSRRIILQMEKASQSNDNDGHEGGGGGRGFVTGLCRTGGSGCQDVRRQSSTAVVCSVTVLIELQTTTCCNKIIYNTVKRSVYCTKSRSIVSWRLIADYSKLRIVRCVGGIRLGNKVPNVPKLREYPCWRKESPSRRLSQDILLDRYCTIHK